jgi:glycosyltransferase involved in cell wall biosynthesis
VESPGGSVIHVIAPGLPFGGAEAVVEALATAGQEFTQVFVLSQIWPREEPAHPYLTRMLERGIRAREIRCGRRKYLAEVTALEKELRTVDARVIHTHGYHSDLVGYFAARRVNVPIVATVHGYIRRSLKEHLYNVADRFILRRFDGAISVSPAIAELLVQSGIDKNKVHIVPNGLSAPSQQLSRADARKKLGLPLDGPAIGWIGRLSPEKGADLLIEAVVAGNVKADVAIIGEGPELPRLQQMISALPAETRQRIHLAGYQTNAAGLLAAFDALAVSSRSEGTPMVILEAVAADVPVVSFEVGGIPDLLTQDIASLAPAGDVNALGAALAEVVADAFKARRKAARARAELVDVLSADRWLGRTMEIYKQAGMRTGEPQGHFGMAMESSR